jgi:hypothetical protein
VEARHRTHLAEARSAGTETLELDPAELLARLEAQAAENGRLEARIEALESAAGAERDARRRLADTLRKERKAAAEIYERAQRHMREHAAAAEELERLRQTAAASDLHVQQAWARLADAEGRAAWDERGLWRRLLRMPPRST